MFRFHMGVQLDSIFKLVAYYLFCCSVDHSVYVGKEKIRFQENTFGKLCCHCRFVLSVFAALLNVAIVRSATMKKRIKFIVTISVASILSIFVTFCCSQHLHNAKKFDTAKQYHCYSDIVLLLGDPMWSFDLENEDERHYAYKVLRENLSKNTELYSNKKVAVWEKSKIGAKCFWVEYKKDSKEIIRCGFVGL